MLPVVLNFILTPTRLDALSLFTNCFHITTLFIVIVHFILNNNMILIFLSKERERERERWTNKNAINLLLNVYLK